MALIDRVLSKWWSPKVTNQGEAAEAVELVRAADALYRDIAMRRLEAQLARSEQLDSKAVSMFTIVSTILPITAGLLSSGEVSLDDAPSAVFALCAGFVAYLVLVAQFVRAYRIGQWDARPDLGQLRDESFERSEDAMNRWIGDNCVNSFFTNSPNIDRKARHVGWAVTCLAVEVGLLTIAVLATLLG